MNEIQYTIAETSERLGNISYRTLHYYEQKFDLNINRDASGNRIYTEYDIEMLENIIDLKKKGMTLDGIKTLLQEKGILKPIDNNIVAVDEKALEIKDLILTEIRTAISQQLQQLNTGIQELNDKIEKLTEENIELKEEIIKMKHLSDEHYKKIDEKLTKWRQDKDRPWYKKYSVQAAF